ncbi:MAG: helix-turn-helix transcriptional regulator [Rhodothermales bacterium]|nr:helix-turn-helix transcriptional regulator [Rhodothermales bacterium]
MAEAMAARLRWIRRFRSLLDNLGTSNFGKSFFETLCTLVDIDDCTVFVIPRGSSPSWLVAEGKDERTRIARLAADQYVRHYYSRDPYITQLRDELRGRPTALRIVHRDSIRDSDYRNRFYDEIDIQEKVSVLSRYEDGYLYSNFYRSAAQAHFGEEQIALLSEASRFTHSCLKRHMSLVSHGVPGKTRASRLQSVYSLLTMREGGKLTAREADVCSRIVLGMSTDGIALDLGVSRNTVATLRKRAYQRLGISSQNELFAICLESLFDSSELNA